MADSKSQKRIREKNKRRMAKETTKVDPEAVEAPEIAPEKVAPTGPEPVGMKERVKQGYLTERDALTLLEESPTTVTTPQIVGWLRRRL
jgi:hypothetical protein